MFNLGDVIELKIEKMALSGLSNLKLLTNAASPIIMTRNIPIINHTIVSIL